MCMCIYIYHACVRTHAKPSSSDSTLLGESGILRRPLNTKPRLQIDANGAQR